MGVWGAKLPALLKSTFDALLDASWYELADMLPMLDIVNAEGLELGTEQKEPSMTGWNFILCESMS